MALSRRLWHRCRLRQSAKKFQAERAVFDKFMNDAQRRAFDDVDNLLTQADSKHDFRRLLVALCRNPAGVAQSWRSTST